MKIDLTKRTDIGTQRTLKVLKNTLLELCEKESFETISVQKICKTRNDFSQAVTQGLYEEATSTDSN